MHKLLTTITSILERSVGSAGALLVYAAIASWAIAPVLISPGARVVGGPDSDVWKHLWGHWWVRDSLLSGRGFPLQTDLIGSPTGGSLYCIDPWDALVSVPLQGLFGAAASFNFQILLHLIVGAFAMYLLAYHVCRSRAGAFLAGVVYAFSPYVLAYPLSSGVTETANIEWLPLYILYLMKTIDESRWRNPMLAALFLFLTSFSCWYYGAFALIFTALYLLYLALAALVSPGRECPDFMKSPAGFGRLIIRLGLMAALFSTAVAAPALAFRSTILSHDSLVPPHVAQRVDVNRMMHLSSAFNNFVILEDLVRPGKENLRSTAVNDRLLRCSYAGVVVLLLALTGVAGQGGRRPWWVLCTAVFLLLALGPPLMVTASAQQGLPDSPFYRLFLQACPFSSNLAVPYRFMLVVMLSLAVLCALGFSRLGAGLSPRRQSLSALALAVLVLAEFSLVSPAPYPALWADAGVPPVYQTLKGVPGRFSILDLPTTDKGSELNVSIYFSYQMVHGKKIPYQICGPFARNLYGNTFTRALVEAELGRPPSDADGSSLAEGRRALAQEKEFRYVLLHERYLQPEAARHLRALLWRYLGRPVLRTRDGDHSLLVFEVF